jgi:hypothetical protein
MTPNGDQGAGAQQKRRLLLQFSCSFFLQGEGTPNGCLRERAGCWDELDVVWEAPNGALWGIAVADGNCWGIAAQTDEAGIGSSKTMAAVVPATSAGALRYGVRRDGGRRRSGGGGASEFEVVMSVSFIITNEIGLKNLI